MRDTEEAIARDAKEALTLRQRKAAHGCQEGQLWDPLRDARVAEFCADVDDEKEVPVPVAESVSSSVHAHRFGANEDGLICECGVTVLPEDLERIGFVQGGRGACQHRQWRELERGIACGDDGLYGCGLVIPRQAFQRATALIIQSETQRANNLADNAQALYERSKRLMGELGAALSEIENLKAKLARAPKPEPFVYTGRGRKSAFP
jgi:hypothetical protein